MSRTASKSDRFRGLLFCGAALVAMAATCQAEAASAPDTTTVAEIVVTATRQAEPLSKVAQSVVALNEAALDARGVKGIDGIAQLTPGITLNPNGFGTQSDISIRGISSQVGSATTGIYIDDTPIQTRVVGYSATNTYPLVFDLERVEVLRGPQGTLFGSGSEGGAIRFITPEPSLTHKSVYARAELAGTDGGAASGEAGLAVGGPIIEDKLGFRASLWERHDGGYVDRKNLNPELAGSAPVDHNANHTDTLVGRVALAWRPMTGLTVTPSVFFQNRRMHDIGTYWEGSSAPGAGKFVNGQPLAQPDHDKFVLPALKIELQLPGVDVISNTSYFEREDQLINDYSTLVPAIFSPPSNFVPGLTSYASYAKMRNLQTAWTEELRAQSSNKSAQLNWVVGLFMSQSKQHAYESIVDPDFGAVLGAPPELVLGLPLIDNKYSLIAESRGVDKQAAVFGEVNYKITDKLKATAGVRVASSTFTGASFGTGAFAGDTIIQPRTKTTETPVTPKLSLAYQADANNLFYATAAKGYRIGGSNAPLSSFCDIGAQGYSSVPANFKSDSLWSYEIGAKNKLFERRLEIATSAYHVDWNNIQQLVYVSNCGQQFVDNTGKATSDGFDIQLTARPTDALTVEASVGYNKAVFSKSIPGLVSKGDHIDTQPWSGTIGVTYETRLLDRYDGYARLDYTYHSRSERTPLTNPDNGGYDPAALPAPQTDLLNLRGGVRFKGYDVSLFVDNLTNAQPRLTRYSEVLGNPVHRDFTYRPLTVGVTASYRY
jgi:outer membrane receptor protein involved in Fe transport